MTCESTILNFLVKAKHRIDSNRYDFIYDDMHRLSELGLTITDAVEMVKNLELIDYFRGPTQDHRNKNQFIYEFGKMVDGVEVYIKLTIREADDLFIMSFHQADRPIKYPYRKK